MPVAIIKTKRLAIRPLEEGDLPCLLAWLTDARVLEFYEGRDTVWTEEAIRAHYYPADEDADMLFRVIMECRRDGRPIGYGQFYQLDDELFEEYRYPNTEGVVFAMDQFIGVPELWNTGLGTEYVKAVFEWLVQERNATAVVLDPRVSNARAVRCYQKAGFEVIATLPEHELHEGTCEDCYLMERKAQISGKAGRT